MADSVINISTSALKPHPRNEEFFSNVEGEEFVRLRDSIKVDGVMTPLRVSPDMTIISGHQRLRACLDLGIKEVPVLIVEGLSDEDDKLRQLIAANFGRMKNDPIKQKNWLMEYERICGVKRGRPDKSGNNSRISQSDIARELGVDESTVRNLKRLDKLLPELQDIISEGRITPTAGFKLLARLSTTEQEQLLQSLPAAQSFTQKQIQSYIDEIAGLKAEKESLAAEKSLIEEEAVEAQRQIMESKDSKEYIALRQKLDSEQLERRKLYDEVQALRAQIASGKKTGSEDLLKSRLELSEVRKALKRSESERQREIAEAVQAALDKQKDAQDTDDNGKVLYKFGANSDPLKVAEHTASTLQVTIGEYLARIRGFVAVPETIQNITSEFKRLLDEGMTLVVSETQNALAILHNKEAKSCKAAS